MLEEVPVPLIEPMSFWATEGVIDSKAWGLDPSFFLVSSISASPTDNNFVVEENIAIDIAFVVDQ